jgi:hypothetical protein
MSKCGSMIVECVAACSLTPMVFFSSDRKSVAPPVLPYPAATVIQPAITDCGTLHRKFLIKLWINLSFPVLQVSVLLLCHVDLSPHIRGVSTNAVWFLYNLPSAWLISAGWLRMDHNSAFQLPYGTISGNNSWYGVDLLVVLSKLPCVYQPVCIIQ